MNINAKKHPSYQHDKEAAMSGVGATAIWDGPFDSTGLPKGKGSSSGKNGMQLKKYPCKEVNPGLPITQRAKQ